MISATASSKTYDIHSGHRRFCATAHHGCDERTTSEGTRATARSVDADECGHKDLSLQ